MTLVTPMAPGPVDGDAVLALTTPVAAIPAPQPLPPSVQPDRRRAQDLATTLQRFFRSDDE